MAAEKGKQDLADTGGTYFSVRCGWLEDAREVAGAVVLAFALMLIG